MKLATWNVNSLKARREIVLGWLKDNPVDVLMMQEIKGLEVPVEDLTAAGYHVSSITQKTYNGVVTLTRAPAEIIADHLPGDEADDQARFLDVLYQGMRIINIYAPNGNPMGTEKFTYKLAWLQRLYGYLEDLRAQQLDVAIAGDFNIIPEAIDAAHPNNWMGDALYQPESRAAYRSFLHLGLTDAFRGLHKGGGLYTFWDYQAGAWPRNDGIRIDHCLLSPRLADRLQAATIDKAPRGLEKPSDHTPLVVTLSAP